MTLAQWMRYLEKQSENPTHCLIIVQREALCAINLNEVYIL